MFLEAEGRTIDTMALQLSDCGYEKKVDWEDSLLNDERDAFLVDELHNLLSSTPRIMVKLSIMLLALSGLLNILLLIFIGQQYSQRGASNPIFPQSIYCRYSIFHIALGYQHQNFDLRLRALGVVNRFLIDLWIP